MSKYGYTQKPVRDKVINTLRPYKLLNKGKNKAGAKFPRTEQSILSKNSGDPVTTGSCGTSKNPQKERHQTSNQTMIQSVDKSRDPLRRLEGINEARLRGDIQQL